MSHEICGRDRDVGNSDIATSICYSCIKCEGILKQKRAIRGIIEKSSRGPVKLHFMTPEVKASIVDKPDNPFKDGLPCRWGGKHDQR
jgi:hypothetical protein